MRSYELNANNAKEVGANTFIDQKGAYVGSFTRAEAIVSENGSEGIEFDFSGREGMANFLTIWTHNKDGEELYGKKMLDGIMTALRLRSIKPVQADIQKRDPESRQMRNYRVQLFPDLMKKPIGLVLCREEYKGRNGVNWKNVIVCPFDAETRQVPAEILGNKPAEQLERILASLKDRPMRRTSAASSGGGSSGGSSSSSGFFDEFRGRGDSGFDDMDDDIPF